MNIKQALSLYIPANEQETKDKKNMLMFIEHNPDYLLRSNETGHFTASAWIVNEKRDKVLFCYHNIYKSWSWVGGHADGEEDLLKVAIKEAKEETGITPLFADEKLLSLETLHVPGHNKNGKYVPSHLHYNLTFLLVADENADIRMKPDENSGVKWVRLEDIEKVSSEPWMVERIYKKLISKT